MNIWQIIFYGFFVIAVIVTGIIKYKFNECDNTVNDLLEKRARRYILNGDKVDINMVFDEDIDKNIKELYHLLNLFKLVSGICITILIVLGAINIYILVK